VAARISRDDGLTALARLLFSALSARRGGGLTYIRNIVRAFPSNTGDWLSILSPQPIEGLPERDDVEWIRAPGWTTRPIPRFLLGAIYFRFFWPRRNDFDVVYYPSGSFDIMLPPRVRRIVAFRNMVPFDQESRLRYDLGWTRFRTWVLRYVQAWAFRRADLVIFISNYARRVIDAAVPSRRGDSVVIPHGSTPTAAPLDSLIAGRLPERFVLYLSILDVYKAHVELVEAWGRLWKQGAPPEKLVLAGPENPRYGARVRATIARLGLEKEVILLGAIPHDQVSDLARRAVFNVFLSSCENCPNILLELMSIGAPLLVSSREPMPELGGPGLDYVEPYDIKAVTAGLARLLDDAERRSRIAAAALDRAQRYSWERTGEKTWQAILRYAAHAPQSANSLQAVDPIGRQ